MRTSDPESHFRYIRMSKDGFDFLLQKVCHQHGYLNLLSLCNIIQVTPFLLRRPYNSATRASICPGERLALTLRYLATGNSQVIQGSLHYCITGNVNMHRCHSHLIIELDAQLLV